MNRSSFFIAAMVFIAGCVDNSFKKTGDGSEYRIISNENGKKAVAGNFIQLNQLAKYKDSVLFSSIENSMPTFIPYDTAQLPPFFKKINEGDSLIIRISTDTLIKSGRNQPYMQKNEYIYQYFKVVKIFASREEAEKAAKPYEAEAKVKQYKKTLDVIKKDLTTNAAQVKTDDQLLTNFMKNNNINAVKTDWGTYVAVETPGTGENLNENSIASIKYTGKTLKDSVFDSNVDPKFGHTEPYDVDLSEFGVIPGWIDGLKLMKKGSKGKLLIPSTLGYGKRGSGKIAPDENLVFDIEVADVLTKEQFEAKQLQRREEMMRQQQMQQEIQRQMQEQMQKRQNTESQPSAPKK